jgi:hypothetical protein
MNDHASILLWKSDLFFHGKVWILSLGLFMCFDYLLVDMFSEFTEDSKIKPDDYPLDS